MADFIFSRKWVSLNPLDVFVYKDEVYVSIVNDCVKVYDTKGVFKRDIGAVELYSPWGIYVYKDEVYVCDRWLSRLRVFGIDGTFKREWSVLRLIGPHFEILGVCVHQDEVWITHWGGSVQVFSLLGVAKRWWSSQYGHPLGIRIYQNEVFICYPIVRRVAVQSMEGVFKRDLAGFGSADGQVHNPHYLDIYTGEVYVGDTRNHRIQVFGLDGAFRRKWGTFGSGNDQFSSPHGVDIYKGEIYIADRGNNRIQVFWITRLLTGKLTFSGSLNWTRTRFKVLTGALTFASRLGRKVSWKRVLIGKLRPTGRTFVGEPTWREDMPTKTEVEETQTGERK